MILVPGRDVLDLAGGLDSIQERHRDVHDDDLGLVQPRQLDSLAPVVRLGDDVDAPVDGQQGAEALRARWCGRRQGVVRICFMRIFRRRAGA